MSVTVGREQNYWRAKCDDKATCAARTASGNIAAYWRGRHRTTLAIAHSDAITHLIARHNVTPVCGRLASVNDRTPCGAPAVGVVQRRGVTLLRCAEHHVDLRTAR